MTRYVGIAQDVTSPTGWTGRWIVEVDGELQVETQVPVCPGIIAADFPGSSIVWE